MKSLNPTNVIRAALLASLATLMVAGFLVMGGLGSGDSAEARCAKRWFDRCPDYSTSTTFDETTTIETTTTGTFDDVLTTTTSTGGFGNCAKRWFNRCYDFTEDLSTTINGD